MKAFSVFVFLIICSSVGYGLKCYGCESTKSWDDCEVSAKTEGTCAAGSNNCAKVHASNNTGGVPVERFIRGCLTDVMCSNSDNIGDMCTGAGTKCQVYCCTSDLCNSAAVQWAIVIILIICALVAIIQ